MGATDAKAIMTKNVAYRATFPILDADGDLVTGAASLDSEVSIDGGAFADCTNEATEIATSSGMYFLDLTAAECNGDTIAVIVKTGTAGAKTTVLVFYTAARSINDLAYPATSGRSLLVDASGGVTITAAQLFVKKNTALSNFEFVMIDAADHISGKTGLTVTAERSIDGGAFAAAANAVTEVANGLYKINLAATDVNGTVITLKFTAAAADATLITIVTQA